MSQLDPQLLAALEAAHNDSNSSDPVVAERGKAAAMAIAAQLNATPVTPQQAEPNASAAPPEGMLHKAARMYGNAVAAPLETGAQMISGAVAQPIAGYAGMGTAAARALGLTDKDPADIVNGVQNALTYQPRTEGGKATSQAVQDIAGIIPKAADQLGQKVSDVTGSPLLGTAANTGLQGAGMLLTGEAGNMAHAAGRGAMKIPGVAPAVHIAQDIATGGESAAKRVMQNAADSGTNGGALAASNALYTRQRALANGAPDLAAKYGFQPTTAQLAQNPGLAGLDRTLRNQPDLATAFGDRDAANQTQVNGILQNISGSPVERARAETARNLKAEDLYGAATSGAPGAAQIAAASSPRLAALMERPAIQESMAKAQELAANDGVSPDQLNPIQQLHYAKLALDDKISAAGRAGNGTEQRILLGARDELLGTMDELSPEYQQARQTFQAMSQPINRMDLGEYLRQKYNSALGDLGGTGTRPSSFAEALRDEDTPATATGFRGATWQSVLSPEDIESLRAAGEHLGRQQYAQNAGRSVGSNTAQNLTGNAALRRIASPDSVSEDLGHPGMVALTLTHPGVSLPLAVLGASARRAALQKMGAAMLDPDLAAKYLKPKQPSEPLNPAIRLAGAEALNADQPQQPMADGGAPDPQYKKSTFWNLVQQAIKEVTGGSDPSPAPTPQPGTQASGPVGRDFDNSINAGVSANE